MVVTMGPVAPPVGFARRELVPHTRPRPASSDGRQEALLRPARGPSSALFPLRPAGSTVALSMALSVALSVALTVALTVALSTTGVPFVSLSTVGAVALPLGGFLSPCALATPPGIAALPPPLASFVGLGTAAPRLIVPVLLLVVVVPCFAGE